MKFLIRPLKASDAPALVRLSALCFDDLHEIFDEPGFRALLNAGCAGLGMFTEEETPQLLGFVLYRAAAGRGEIISLGVHPEKRRQGIAKALMTALCEVLRGEAVEDLWLEVRASNKSAIALYEGLGAYPGPERLAYYDPLPGKTVREDALMYTIHLF